MRSHAVAVAVAAVLLLPQLGSAQVYLWSTPVPQVTAAHEAWRTGGEPIFYAGRLYYPTGPTEYFDGQVMARTGNYKGVPLYENRTLEPYSVVFVPIGGNLMRPYERKREGELVGTVGSRTPSFPIQRDVEISSLMGYEEPLVDVGEVSDRISRRAQWDWPEPTPEIEAPPLAPLSTRSAAPGTTVAIVRTVPPSETTNAGAFVEFEGARYFSSGKAQVNNPDRFTRVGEARGASVYREVKGAAQTIYVEAVPGGALAPYTRR
jgi:hypothetical protein